MRLVFLSITLFVTGGLTSQTPGVTWQAIRRPGDAFRGYIHADTREVELEPPMKVASTTGQAVCGFSLYPMPTESGELPSLPFVTEVTDRTNGRGRLLADVSADLGPTSPPRYRFQIDAFDCSSPPVRSDRVWVDMELVPAERPLWTQTVYNAVTMDDVPLGSNVITVVAFEMGRTAGNSICHYRIQAPLDSPFDIDGHGTIKTKDRLNATQHANYVLRVMAEDCWPGNPRTSTVSVNIAVKHACIPGWTGVPEQINYVPGSGVHSLLPQVSFDRCEGVHLCPEDRVTTTVTLDGIDVPTSGIPSHQTCERDVYALRSQSKMCDTNTQTSELLPSADTFTAQAEGTVDPVEEVYNFDGVKTHWEVPTSAVPASHNLGNQFTLAFWMKHEQREEHKGEEDKAMKEQILCNADGEAKNRHHYSVFLRHCKLILLLRRESSGDGVPVGDPEEGVMSPAEWRFQLGEVCDGNWHHYAIVFTNTQTPGSVESPRVKLMVDGRVFAGETGDQNAEVISDWALHWAPGVHFTRLSVGACWHAKEKAYRQFFKGQLAGLTLLRGQIESDRAIRCLSRCYERLDFHAMNQMNPGMSVSLNSELSMIIVNGHNQSEVAKLVKKISYINTRTHPTTGKRQIKVATEIRCRNNGSILQIPDSRITVLVMSPTDPSVLTQASSDQMIDLAPALVEPKITGDTKLPVHEEVLQPETSLGQIIFPNLSIDAHDSLDSCIIRTWPRLSFPIEFITWPRDRVSQIAAASGSVFYGVNTTHGLVLEGVESATVYRDLLQEVRYLHTNPTQINERSFEVTCSQSNGEITSNQFTTKLEIIHPGGSVFSSLSEDTEPEDLLGHPVDSIRSEDDAYVQSQMVHAGPVAVAKVSHSRQHFSSRIKDTTLFHQTAQEPSALVEKDITGSQIAVYAVLGLCGTILLVLAIFGFLKRRSVRWSDAYNNNKSSGGITNSFRSQYNHPGNYTGNSGGRKVPPAVSEGLESAGRLARSLVDGGRRLGERVARRATGVEGHGLEEMEWDNSELNGLKVIVNPMEQHEDAFCGDMEMDLPNNTVAGSRYQQLPCQASDDEDQESSLDGLPDDDLLDDEEELVDYGDDVEGDEMDQMAGGTGMNDDMFHSDTINGNHVHSPTGSGLTGSVMGGAGLLTRGNRRSQLLEWDDAGLMLPPAMPHMTRSVSSLSGGGSKRGHIAI